MTKEEIALQLTINIIKDIEYRHLNSYKSGQDEKFNKELGEQVASLYTSIYENLSCLDIKQTFTSDEEFICQTIV